VSGLQSSKGCQGSQRGTAGQLTTPTVTEARLKELVTANSSETRVKTDESRQEAPRRGRRPAIIAITAEARARDRNPLGLKALRST